MEVAGTANMAPRETQYLLDYLELNERLLKEEGHPTALKSEYRYDDDDCRHEIPNVWIGRLQELNDVALENGVTEAIIRREYIAHSALSNSGNWYSSSNEC